MEHGMIVIESLVLRNKTVIEWCLYSHIESLSEAKQMWNDMYDTHLVRVHSRKPYGTT